MLNVKRPLTLMMDHHHNQLPDKTLILLQRDVLEEQPHKMRDLHSNQVTLNVDHLRGQPGGP